MKNILLVLLVIAVAFLGYQNYKKPVEVSAKSPVADLVTFVNRASALVGTNGETAFADFKKPGEWQQGDSYIFVYDMAGNTLVLPPQVDLEGTNRMTATDPNGKAFVKEMIDILGIKPSGWIDYMYAKPGTTTPSLKLSYFKKVTSGGKDYLVGSGIYAE
jgi:methyl-accepting chemotaxis protein